MKKILQRTALIVLAVLIAIGITVYFMFFHDPGAEDKRVTATDANGNAYVVETDEDGTTYAVVQGDDGQVWKAEINDDGSVGSTVEHDSDYDSNDIITTYTGPDINETVNGSDYAGDVSEGTAATDAAGTTAATTDAAGTTAATTAAGTTAASNTTAAGTTASGNNTTASSSSDEPKILKYQEIFESGTYYMEFTTNDEELGDTPIVTASKNGNLLITTSIDGMSCEMLYLKDKDKTYLILPDYKKYCSIPESMLGDDFSMDEFSLMDKFAADVDADDIKIDTVTINGKTLERESYTTEDGSRMRYYFDGDTLVRLDNIDSNEGTATETYISKITNDVPDSTFEIPDGYGYLNLSWLDMLSGSSSTTTTAAAN